MTVEKASEIPMHPSFHGHGLSQSSMTLCGVGGLLVVVKKVWYYETPGVGGIPGYSKVFPQTGHTPGSQVCAGSGHMQVLCEANCVFLTSS